MYRSQGSNPSLSAIIVRKPILNKIIKIGDQSVCCVESTHFSYIL